MLVCPCRKSISNHIVHKNRVQSGNSCKNQLGTFFYICLWKVMPSLRQNERTHGKYQKNKRQRMLQKEPNWSKKCLQSSKIRSKRQLREVWHQTRDHTSPRWRFFNPWRNKKYKDKQTTTSILFHERGNGKKNSSDMERQLLNLAKLKLRVAPH